MHKNEENCFYSSAKLPDLKWKKRVDTLCIVSKQRCARCGRVHVWIGIRRIFL